MDERNPFITAEYLFLYRLNKLSPHEAAQIEKALQADPELAQLLHELDDKVQIEKELSLLQSFDANQAFSNATKLIAPKTPFWQRRTWLIAASILLLLISGALLVPFLLRSSNERVLITRQQGVHEPILKLASGEEIKLDTLTQIRKNGVIAQNNAGTLIMEDHTGIDAGALNILTVPYQHTYQVVLSDGTRVHLNAGSSLSFPTAFTPNERRVKLSGEAYFEVMPQAKRRFIVEADEVQVEVLGTTFNIEAYQDDAQIRTTLITGKVAVHVPNEDSRILSPNEQSVFDRKAGRTFVNKIDSESAIVWQNGWLDFDNHTLESVMRRIARHYNLAIEFEEAQTSKILVSGKMKMYSDANDVFRKFEKLGDVSFQVHGKQVLVRSNHSL